MKKLPSSRVSHTKALTVFALGPFAFLEKVNSYVHVFYYVRAKRERILIRTFEPVTLCSTRNKRQSRFSDRKKNYYLS